MMKTFDSNELILSSYNYMIFFQHMSQSDGIFLTHPSQAIDSFWKPLFTDTNLRIDRIELSIKHSVNNVVIWSI